MPARILRLYPEVRKSSSLSSTAPAREWEARTFIAVSVFPTLPGGARITEWNEPRFRFGSFHDRERKIGAFIPIVQCNKDMLAMRLLQGKK